MICEDSVYAYTNSIFLAKYKGDPIEVRDDLHRSTSEYEVRDGLSLLVYP